MKNWQCIDNPWDGTDIHLLGKLRIYGCFCWINRYDEQNLLMALMAKQAGVSKLLTNSRENYIKSIDKLGIDAAFNPMYITAEYIKAY